MLRQCYAAAGVSPGEISYVEAHGTGTALGDPIEVRALGTVLATGRVSGSLCALGSVKTNIGHLEAAAGVAGLIKTVLMLRHRELVPSLHFTHPNPSIPFGELPVAVQQSAAPWNAPRRLAGVSAFGFGGTNAHVVVEEGMGERGETAGEGEGWRVLPLSARSGGALRELAEAYCGVLGGEGGLGDVCYTAAVRRGHYEHRVAVVGRTAAGMAGALGKWVGGAGAEGVWAGRREPGRKPRVGFVFSGQGAQWGGMGRELLASEPVFREAVERCERAWRRHAEWSLEGALREEGEGAGLEQTEVAQPAIFAMQVGLAALYGAWGMEPGWVVGHSVGEIAAAHVAGILTLEEAVTVVFHRGRLMQRGTGQGAMAAVKLGRVAAEARVAGWGGALSVAAENGPGSCVLSGEGAAIAAVLAGLEAEGIVGKRLEVNYAFHSRQMEPYQGELKAALAGLRPGAARVPMVSSVTGREVAGPELDGGYWARGIRERVEFAEALRAAMAGSGETTVLEVGAHPVLGGNIREVMEAAGQRGEVLATLRRGREAQRQTREALGAYYAQGGAVQWGAVMPAGRVVALPAYRWQRTPCWLEPAHLRGPRAGQNGAASPPASSGHPLLGHRLRSPLLEGVVFESSLGPVALPFLGSHRVHGRALFPASGFLALALAGAEEAFPGAAVLDSVEIHEALVFSEAGDRTLQLAFDVPRDGVAGFRIFALAEDGGGEAVWKLHAGGRVSTGPRDAASIRSGMTLDTLLAECREQIDVEGYYSRLLDHGLEYGPAFRAIERAWRTPGQAVAEVRLPESVTDGLAVHPVLLDAAFQLVLAALPEWTSDAPANSTYLPVAVESLRLSGALPERMWSGVRVRTSDSSDSIAADLTLFDQDGREVASLVGLRLLRVRGALNAGRDQTDAWLHELEWRAQPVEDAAAKGQSPATWVLLTDSGGVGQALAARLAARGDQVVLLRRADRFLAEGAALSVDPGEPESFREFFERLDNVQPPCRAIVHLWSLDATHAEDADADAVEAGQIPGVRSVLSLVQGLVGARIDSPRLVLVTRGAQAVPHDAAPAAVVSSPLWGLARVIALEMPALRCLRIDLDPGAPADPAALLAELDTVGPEDQVALRGSGRLVPRLVRRRAEAGRLPIPDGPYELHIGRRGILENLELLPAARIAPGPDEVEIRVSATGLNFRDVMNALGLYSGDAGRFGAECAGTVAALGEGVRGLRVGDRVMGVGPGCFGAYVTTRADLVAPIPESMSLEAAAGVPVAFLTAYYALHRLGGLRAGDRVLIHAAAGGVGLAAVQLALRAGAEVFGTAGSPEKRTLLRERGVPHVFSSRTLDFVEGVREATGGNGVDVVLNSLARDFIPRSLETLRPGGRFLEIGKVGIWDAARVAASGPRSTIT